MKAVSTTSLLVGTTLVVGAAMAWPLAAHPSARTDAGIREAISSTDKARYQVWKDEFLATESGRREWQGYAQDPRLLLTIATSTDNKYGAGIGHYEWNRAGQLTAATITLGSRLDQEYPGPVYYPVLNALKQEELQGTVAHSVLAAAKMAHEFGHLSRMLATDAEVYRLQTELIPSYNAIITNNGRNPRDPRLQDLVRRMGGTPTEIWEDREYWGETHAMLYLRDRITDGALQCSLFSHILKNVDTYASKTYRSRFAQIADAQAAVNHCAR